MSDAQTTLFSQVEHVNNFHCSLQRSHRASDLPIWETCYRQFFFAFQAMHDHRQDGEHQRQGIDRTIVLHNGKTVAIDEKVREKNRKTGRVYQDIALEEVSDHARGSPGWVIKPLLCDYIAYAILPLGKCYLLSVQQLQQSWLKHGALWKQQYPRIAAQNETNGRRWTTVSWGIPVDILFKSIGQQLQAAFPAKDFVQDY